jgi:hypothetical protein
MVWGCQEIALSFDILHGDGWINPALQAQSGLFEKMPRAADMGQITPRCFLRCPAKAALTHENKNLHGAVPLKLAKTIQFPGPYREPASWGKL